MIRHAMKELSDALWATRSAAQHAVRAFRKRWPYLWSQRQRRHTIDMVESWYDDPDRAP